MGYYTFLDNTSASSSSSPSSTATNNREQEEIGHNDLEIPFFKDFINYMDIISVIPTFIEAADLFEPLPLINTNFYF